MRPLVKLIPCGELGAYGNPHAPLRISAFDKFYSTRQPMICKLRTATKYTEVEDLADFLKEMEDGKDEITTLDVSMNTFTPPVAKELAKRIAGLTKLKKIELGSILDSLKIEDMNIVIPALIDALPLTLEELEMPSNALSCNYPKELSKFIKNCPLRVLNLFDCGLGEEGLRRISGDLSEQENKANLRSLNLGKNRINVIHKEFAEVLNSFEGLAELRIRSNTIEKESLTGFLERLDGGKLAVLDLSDNFVRGGCEVALGELFKRAPIEQLYLFDSKMDGDELSQFLAKALEKQVEEKPKLVLDVSVCWGNEACVPLLEQLAAQYAIKRLVLFENDFEASEDLISLVRESGGVVISDEENQNVEEFVVEHDLVARISRM